MFEQISDSFIAGILQCKYLKKINKKNKKNIDLPTPKKFELKGHHKL